MEVVYRTERVHPVAEAYGFLAAVALAREVQLFEEGAVGLLAVVDHPTLPRYVRGVGVDAPLTVELAESGDDGEAVVRPEVDAAGDVYPVAGVPAEPPPPLVGDELPADLADGHLVDYDGRAEHRLVLDVPEDGRISS